MDNIENENAKNNISAFKENAFINIAVPVSY